MESRKRRGPTRRPGSSEVNDAAAETSFGAEIGRVMEGYAQRGIFRSFGASTCDNVTTLTVLWHADRIFEVVADDTRRRLTIPMILPAISPKSMMHRRYREFVADFSSVRRPPHRRVDPRKCNLKVGNVKENVSLALTVRDSDFEYGARRLIAVIHETYMVFLRRGPYYEYRIRQLGQNADLS